MMGMALMLSLRDAIFSLVTIEMIHMTAGFGMSHISLLTI